jgi:bifunctional DNA-binding transcriptional regulator/antitoxin component of YhaV-PrlF toxin-antitoxin module
MEAERRAVEPVQLEEEGKITVPPRFRRTHRLKKGSRMLLVEVGNGLMLVPPDPGFDALCETLRATLARKGITARTLLRDLPKVRKQLFDERYGKARRET